MNKKLALDIGEKRIGVAISDGLGMLAHPLKTLKWKNINTLVEDLNQIISSHDIDCVVVGIPYSMKGTLSAKTEQVIEIVDQLRSVLEIKIEEIDERLTTKMAERDLHAMNKKPSKNREIIDQIAAVYILQTYLDRNKLS